jgi:Uma2 family endonuclease
MTTNIKVKEGYVMDVQLLKRIKKLQKLTNEDLAKKSGVPVGTLNKIFSGATKSPKHDTIQALADALKSNSYESDYDTNILREAMAYDVNRKYTIEDYYALPDDARVELIDGSFYVMEAPSAAHQTILGELYYVIKSFIKKNNGKCKVYLSPFDVRLDNDNKTMVQPDIIVVCEKSKVDGKRCNGAPDFLAEIVSPNSARLDYIKKLNKYLDAGVREYWIIDPYKNMVTVYSFEKENTPKNYMFSDQIPFGIFEGLNIDFRDIEKELEDIGGTI